MRVEIRDAEWRIKRVDYSSDAGYLLRCEGLSELVQGREALFLSKLDEPRILDPKDTQLVDDVSSNFGASLLYIDSMLRKTAPSDVRIHLGHRAAVDDLPFQREPALQALEQPRQRILIADAVGLGKTLEAGILTSELIARGRGKRILVLAVKSMLTQFQQEFWTRFTIPLVRVDSTGLQRVRNRIPSNHNPFHYFDRASISIDTLKQDIEYRHHLEQAYWDIIIIDEAQNVAERGSNSQGSRLARLLSTRSDTLIMLSATPHDGKPDSFASLVKMFDSTAIANQSDYAQEDHRDKGMVIRRFKKDVRDQLKAASRSARSQWKRLRPRGRRRQPTKAFCISHSTPWTVKAGRAAGVCSAPSWRRRFSQAPLRACYRAYASERFVIRGSLRIAKGPILMPTGWLGRVRYEQVQH